MDTGIYTDTLARLYLKQGFIEQALTIYRRLAHDQPENCQWHETIMTLEQQLLLAGTEQPVHSPAPLSPPPASPQRRPTCCRTHRVIAQLTRWLAGVQQVQHR